MAGSDVQDQDITELVSESLLLELTDQHLAWKFLGRHLELTEGNLDEIEQKHKGDIKEMKYQTLLKWKQKFGKRATIGKLAKALKEVGRTDLADDVMQDQRNHAALLLPQPPNGQRNCQPPPQQANDNGDTADSPMLGAEGNGATAPANPQGANAFPMTSLAPSQSGDERYVNTPLQSNIGSSDQQWQFEPEELGDQYVHEHVLSILATRIFRNHAGKEFSDVRYFCSQLGIPSTVCNKVCMDKKQSTTDELLYYVFLDWRMASSLTRNKLRKALFDFDQMKKTSLCKFYVRIVNDRFREDSSENS